MGLLDVMTDPFGQRYKRKGWSERAGLKGAKTKFTKTFIQPFSKLNPMYHLRNAKRNIKRRLGYNSEFAKAYRSGEWGKYVKRKIMNSDRPTMIMPFKESQYTPYDMQSNPFDKEQTNPTRKGIFHKLSTYAAPGALMGLVYASRKMKLFDKLRGKHVPPEVKTAMQKIKDGGKALMGKLHTKAGLAYNFTKQHAKNAAVGALDTAKLIAYSAKHHAKKFASKQYKGAKAKWDKLTGPISVHHTGKVRKTATNRATSATHKASADSGLIMPFRESYHDNDERYNPPSRRRGSSFTEKIVTAGVLGAGALAAFKLHSTLSDPVKLAVKAEEAYRKMRSLEKVSDKYTHALAPIKHAQTAYAQMRHSVYSGLATTANLFAPNKTIKVADKAAKMNRLKATLKALEKKHPGISLDTETVKQLRRSIMRGEQGGIKSAKEAYGVDHPKKTPNSPAHKPTQDNATTIADPSVHPNGVRLDIKPKAPTKPWKAPTKQDLESWGSLHASTKQNVKAPKIPTKVAKTPRRRNPKKVVNPYAAEHKGIKKNYRVKAPKLPHKRKESNALRGFIMPFRESLAASLSSQASHTFPTLGGTVPSLALHYGSEWAGDEAYKKLKKHPKAKKAYDKVFLSRKPKQRPGKFVADLSSIGGTAAGIKLAGKLKGAKSKLIAQLLGGVAGHTLGKLGGNKIGVALNKKLYAERRRNK